ncbi:glycosyltransferase family 4 protein [Flavicella sp.]|uniref:glycosyltransferase family 4 protein n=1 Tax=Flavicella sp. TaxID=2957742 RepID=UPI0030199755
MKVLILTYYWPPAGGSGVQRWLKFVKYLQGFGITPIVYTVDNPDFSIEDIGLSKDIPEGIEVLKQPIWEPYQLVSFFSKGKKAKTNAGFLKSNQTLFGRFSTYIRANYFIPDARMFWIKPSVKFLEKYIKENSVDIIISSGPPHSLHKIALELKQKTNIKWISDFRDPWTDIDYFHQLPLTEKAKRKHFSMEQEVLENSDSVIVVGKTMRENYLKFNKKTVVITNGYDVDISVEKTKLDSKFSITHIGMMNEDRNPIILWKSLALLSNEIKGFSENFTIQLIGNLDASVIDAIRENGLMENTKLIAYLPHEEVYEYQKKSQLLLLAVNNVPSAKGIITGKIFEYLVAKRPILAIGPIDGDLAEILRETNSGTIVNFTELEKIKEIIKRYYKDYLQQKLNVSSIDIHKYHRKELTKELAELIKTTVC